MFTASRSGLCLAALLHMRELLPLLPAASQGGSTGNVVDRPAVLTMDML